jgi:hypothetical protein
LPNSAEFTGAVALAVSSVLFAQAGVEAGHEAISGDRVGYMGDALSDHGWAYVAGVKIAAEIPLEDTLSFRGADREQRDEALNWLASTGARVLVTRDVPNTAMPMGLAEERAIRTTAFGSCRKWDEQNSPAERVTAAPVLQVQKRRLAAALQK